MWCWEDLHTQINNRTTFNNTEGTTLCNIVDTVGVPPITEFLVRGTVVLLKILMKTWTMMWKRLYAGKEKPRKWDT